MKFSILTKTLQDLINKVIKGAGNNKILPLTSMLDINLKDGVLSLTTTDMNNYVTVKETGINGEDFNVVIPIDSFSKLVTKTTTETVTLELEESSLKFVGNGTYNLPLSLDEEDEMVRFPEYSFPIEYDTETIKLSDLRTVFENNSTCISTDMSTPCLTGFYFDDNVITTDSVAICINKTKIFNSPVLLSAVMVGLLNLFDKEDITVQIANNKIKFITSNVILCGTTMNEVDEYPAEAIESYLDATFEHSCKLNKSALLGVLDRMLIFIDDNRDNFCASITFSNKGVLIRNKDNTANEIIPYVADASIKPLENSYSCDINIDIFKSQVSSCKGNTVLIYFAHEDDVCIKIEDESIVKIIALTAEDADNLDEEE